MSISEEFIKAKGKPIIYNDKKLRMQAEFAFSDNQIEFKLEIMKTNSEMRQGLIVASEGDIIINNKTYSKIILWEDTAPKEVLLTVKSKDKRFSVYNVWQKEQRTEAWYNDSYMELLKKINNSYFFSCSDGKINSMEKTLDFKIEFENNNVKMIDF
ncbi:MAG: hypothetical protein KDD26_10495 [Winogradskyella sp.]|nr:hypothetical protein [Winogradskyella sp.]